MIPYLELRAVTYKCVGRSIKSAFRSGRGSFCDYALKYADTEDVKYN